MKLHLSSTHLDCSVPGILPGASEAKSEGDEKVITPTLNPLKAFRLDIDYCFISAKPWEAPRASLDLPLQWVIFRRHFWASGNNSRIVKRRSGIFKEDEAANRGGVFVSMWRWVGFQRQLTKTQPSLLVHITAWRICQKSWWYLLGLITAAVCPPSTIISYC